MFWLHLSCQSSRALNRGPVHVTQEIGDIFVTQQIRMILLLKKPPFRAITYPQFVNEVSFPVFIG